MRVGRLVIAIMCVSAFVGYAGPVTAAPTVGAHDAAAAARAVVATVPATAASMLPRAARPAASFALPRGNATADWRNNDLVGYCGDTHGGYVVAVQALLYARDLYSGSVDNVFGTQTFNAVEQYQRNNGLSPVDGCVGPDTWHSMQNKLQPPDNHVNGANGRPTIPFPRGSGSQFSCGHWWSDLDQSSIPVTSPVTHRIWLFDAGLYYTSSVVFC